MKKLITILLLINFSLFYSQKLDLPIEKKVQSIILKNKKPKIIEVPFSKDNEVIIDYGNGVVEYRKKHRENFDRINIYYLVDDKLVYLKQKGLYDVVYQGKLSENPTIGEPFETLTLYNSDSVDYYERRIDLHKNDNIDLVKKNLLDKKFEFRKISNSSYERELNNYNFNVKIYLNMKL